MFFSQGTLSPWDKSAHSYFALRRTKAPSVTGDEFGSLPTFWCIWV